MWGVMTEYGAFVLPVVEPNGYHFESVPVSAIFAVLTGAAVVAAVVAVAVAVATAVKDRGW